MEQMEDGFGGALLKDGVGRDRTACYSGRVSGICTFLRGNAGCFVPDKVPDREAGMNGSGNTGLTRLLCMRREDVFYFKKMIKEKQKNGKEEILYHHCHCLHIR